jgi:hypothetical protein
MEGTTEPSPLEQLAEEVDQLETRLASLDAAGVASKWLGQRKSEWNRALQLRDQDVSMRWLTAHKASLQRWIATVIGERTQHAAAVQAVKAADSARHTSLTAQAHARIDPALVQAEAAARAAVEIAQQARDAAQRALINHEAHVPSADHRPAWQRTRRDLVDVVEDAVLSVAEAAAAHADAQRAFRAARSAAWAELLSETVEAFSARLTSAQAAVSAAQEACAAEAQAGRDALQDVQTARLLDT